VHRVVTDIRDYRGKRILEAGPWHKTQSEADGWAEILRGLGYFVKVERMQGEISGGGPGGDEELANALAGMA
jgi:hypothetical protein